MEIVGNDELIPALNSLITYIEPEEMFKYAQSLCVHLVEAFNRRVRALHQQHQQLNANENDYDAEEGNALVAIGCLGGKLPDIAMFFVHSST